MFRLLEFLTVVLGGRLEVVAFEFPVRHLPETLDGVVISLLSDFHFGSPKLGPDATGTVGTRSRISTSLLDRAIDAVNAANPGLSTVEQPNEFDFQKIYVFSLATLYNMTQQLPQNWLIVGCPRLRPTLQ